MKKRAFLFGILLVVISAPPQARADSKDEKEIKALEDRVMAATKAKDVDAIMANYLDDDTLVVFDLITPRQYVGAKAYRKDLHDFLATVSGPMTTCEITELSIMTDGKLGVSHSIQHAVWNDKDGKRLEVTIRATDVYRKIGGKWLIVHEHSSAPVDPKSGAADFSSSP